MIQDALLRFSVVQVLTTGTQVSINSYDLGVAREAGRGDDLRVRVTVNSAFAGGSSLQVNIVEDSQGSLATATLVQGGTPFAEGALTVGKVVLDIVPPLTTKRYIGLQYVSIGTHTAGAVDGGIVFDTDSAVTFPAVVGF